MFESLPSQTWQDKDAPDKSGEQQRAVMNYLLEHTEVEYVWFE